MKAPKMPAEYKGETTTSGGYTLTAPRKWTPQEIDFVKGLLAQGYTTQEIAESIERTVTATSIKIKRLSKKQGSYNADHLEAKYEANKRYIDAIQPNSLLDCYSGKQSYYKGKVKELVTNDKDEEAEADHHEDALKLLCGLYRQERKFDVIDLDPYGSAYDCFDLAIKLAKKGLVITFGELGHKRFKRLDYVERYYNIKTLEDFTLEALIEQVQVIGRRNKKELKVFASYEWRNIGRVYFTVEPLKITKQWDKTA